MCGVGGGGCNGGFELYNIHLFVPTGSKNERDSVHRAHRYAENPRDETYDIPEADVDFKLDISDSVVIGNPIDIKVIQQFNWYVHKLVYCYSISFSLLYYTVYMLLIYYSLQSYMYYQFPIRIVLYYYCVEKWKNMFSDMMRNKTLSQHQFILVFHKAAFYHIYYSIYTHLTLQHHKHQ